MAFGRAGTERESARRKKSKGLAPQARWHAGVASIPQRDSGIRERWDEHGRASVFEAYLVSARL